MVMNSKNSKKPVNLYYVYSCDLPMNVQIKIGTLEGMREKPTLAELIGDPLIRYSGAYQELFSDMYVTCQVFSDNNPLSLPIRTAHKSFTSRCNWNEWLTIPIKFCDLPRNAQLVLTIWDICGCNEVTPVGGTTVSLFGKHGIFRQGMHDLKIWQKVEGDGASNTTTPGKISTKEDNMSRLAKYSKKHRDGHISKIDWLDRLTFREIEMINEKEKRNSNFLFLMIEFPHVILEENEYAIVYYESGNDKFSHTTHGEMVFVPDQEIGLENFVENKHRKLTRSLRNDPTDKDLKPNASTRDQLNLILTNPPTESLKSEEKDLIWQYRFYLSNQKKALTKFLKSVNWNDSAEAKHSLLMLKRWSPIDIDDALELLGPSFTHPMVRRYAVARLREADDEVILLYLLQLVQALKYENIDSEFYVKENNDQEDNYNFSKDNSNTNLMVNSVESKDDKDNFSPKLVEDINQESLLDALEENEQAKNDVNKTDVDLASFLISRACNNSKVAHFFYWYVYVEQEDQHYYNLILKQFSKALQHGNDVQRKRRSALANQENFMVRLNTLVERVSGESSDRLKKIEKLRHLLEFPEALHYDFSVLNGIPLPLDPDVKMHSIDSETAYIFKSNLSPVKFTFRDQNNKEYIAIFKHGDDLRQDQLVLQMVTLMDRILQQENLDLKLTPYRVLATSRQQGFVQYVDSNSVAEILRNDETILNFFRKHNPCSNGPYGVMPDVLDNYIKSCAGYCVITYILSVGDRHLDNLLLQHNGKLFHIDFGYILGRDPKPMPPAMKLTKEMVDGMGSIDSDYFKDFRKQCFSAFLLLRRHSNLILNLFSLMVDADVQDIKLEPDKAVKKVFEKFRLNLNDEAAVKYFDELIDASIGAKVASIIEKFHTLAQFVRK